jgi:type I restriction enzyme, S subunit
MYNKGIFVELQNLYRVQKEINEDYKLKYGDLLFVRSSVKREGVGFTAAFKQFNEDVTYCGFIIRARVNSEKLFPEFATYFFRTSDQRNKIVSKAKQVTITNISQDRLSELTLPLPPLPEQKKIVAKIEELFSELDNGIEQLVRAKEQLRYLQAGCAELGV